MNLGQRQYWVHPFNLDVKTKGEYFIDFPDLRKYPVKFFRTYRMSVQQFDFLLDMLSETITKQNNNYRETISA